MHGSPAGGSGVGDQVPARWGTEPPAPPFVFDGRVDHEVASGAGAHAFLVCSGAGGFDGADGSVGGGDGGGLPDPLFGAVGWGVSVGWLEPHRPTIRDETVWVNGPPDQRVVGVTEGFVTNENGWSERVFVEPQVLVEPRQPARRPPATVLFDHHQVIETGRGSQQDRFGQATFERGCFGAHQPEDRVLDERIEADVVHSPKVP